MALKPAGHRILIKPDVLEETDPTYASAKAAGIVLAKNHEDMRREQASVDKGTVLAIGDTAFKDFGTSAWCKVGDRIAYAKFAGKYIKDETDGNDYLIINDEDVVAILEKGEA
jgi:co-chaperonin GroES (HSP10)